MKLSTRQMIIIGAFILAMTALLIRPELFGDVTGFLSRMFGGQVESVLDEAPAGPEAP